MNRHTLLAAVALFAVLALPAAAQGRLPGGWDLPDPAEDLCTDPVHLYLGSLEPGQVAKEFEGGNDAVSFLVKFVFVSLEEVDCDNYAGTFDVRWRFEFHDLDGLVLEHAGILVVEKDEGEYATVFFAENSKEGEVPMGPLHLDYAAAYQVEAEIPFDVLVDDRGKIHVEPEALLLSVHVDVAGTLSETIDDRLVDLEGVLAAAVDLDVALVPLGDGAFAYDGQLSYAWSTHVEGTIGSGRYVKAIDRQNADEGSIPLSGETSLEQIAAALAGLRARIEQILGDLEG